MKIYSLFALVSLLSNSAFGKSSDIFCTAADTIPPSLHPYQILFKPGWSHGWLYSTAYVMKDAELMEDGKLTCEWDYIPSPGMSSAFYCYEPGKKKQGGLKAWIVPRTSSGKYTYHAGLYRDSVNTYLGGFNCSPL